MTNLGRLLATWEPRARDENRAARTETATPVGARRITGYYSYGGRRRPKTQRDRGILRARPVLVASAAPPGGGAGLGPATRARRHRPAPGGGVSVFIHLGPWLFIPVPRRLGDVGRGDKLGEFVLAEAERER